MRSQPSSPFSLSSHTTESTQEFSSSLSSPSRGPKSLAAASPQMPYSVIKFATYLAKERKLSTNSTLDLGRSESPYSKLPVIYVFISKTKCVARESCFLSVRCGESIVSDNKLTRRRVSRSFRAPPKKGMHSCDAGKRHESANAKNKC